MIRTIKKILHRGNKFKVISRKDGVFLVNYSNFIDRKLIIDGEYERAQLDRFSAIADELGVEQFIDIGANIGLYTVKLGKLSTVREVHAFEPMPANKNQLHANILLNNLNAKVFVYPFALSSENGSAVFLQNKGNSTGRSRIKSTNVNKLDDNKFEEVEVQIKRLDGILSADSKKLAIKIDVEGHELKVLEGMTSILKRNTCVIQIEAYESSVKATEDLLKTLGYILIDSIGADHYYSNRVA